MHRVGIVWLVLMAAVGMAIGQAWADDNKPNTLRIHKAGSVVWSGAVKDVDSIVFPSVKLQRIMGNNDILLTKTVSQIDSMTFCYVNLDSLATYWKYSLQLYLTKEKTSSQQGMDICNDNIFAMQDGGTCYVYSYTNKSLLGNFKLASARSGNHCNTANFGIETAPGASFPLLYVSIGKVGDKDEFALYVESITLSDGTYSSVLAQTIRMDQSEFAAKGLQPIWGCPNWVVDKERGYLWAFSAIKRTLVSTTGDMSTNKYVATKYRIPKLSEGTEVVLTADDVLDQAIMTFDTYITQGGTMSDGKIYYCYGYSGTSTTTPQRIRVYDTDTRQIVGRLEISSNITVEPEDLSLYNNKLYLNTNSANLYEIVVEE